MWTVLLEHALYGVTVRHVEQQRLHVEVRMAVFELDVDEEQRRLGHVGKQEPPRPLI